MTRQVINNEQARDILAAKSLKTLSTNRKRDLLDQQQIFLPCLHSVLKRHLTYVHACSACMYSITFTCTRSEKTDLRDVNESLLWPADSDLDKWCSALCWNCKLLLLIEGLVVHHDSLKITLERVRALWWRETGKAKKKPKTVCVFWGGGEGGVLKALAVRWMTVAVSRQK